MSNVFINDNMVIEINDASESEVDQVRHLYQVVLDSSTISRAPKVGWEYVNGLVRPKILPVTPRQMRQALILYGVMSTIEAAFETFPEPTKSLALTEWEYSNEFDRYRPLVNSVRLLLGWTEDQTDELWAFASTL